MRKTLDDRAVNLRRERESAPATLRPLLIAVLLVVAAIGLLLTDRSGRLAPVRGALQGGLTFIAQPLLGLRDQVGSVLSGNWGSAAAERAALEQEISQLRAELIAREQAQIENEQLRRQLAIEQATPWRLIGAEVVVRFPDAGRRVMTIARGRRDGLSVGMPVIGQTGTNPAALVGVVESVGPRSADVLLITDFGSQLSARVLHDGQSVLGLLRGQWQRGSRLQLESIDREAPIAVGDAVVTAGLTSMLNLPLNLAYIPPDIPIGTIESLAIADQNQIAAIRPFLDPDQVRYVWVILNPED